MNEAMPEARYAIYFVPDADKALYRFGASVLGYDCYGGRDVAFIDGAAFWPWTDFVREPRRYGFHATLKAPFRLAKGLQEADLERAVVRFAANHSAVPVGEIVVRELGSFIAFVPAAPTAPLGQFAGACVRDFDQFRSPLAAAEGERRMAANPNLSARQIAHLERWGYPYVFEDFRFHMTLTGSLPQSERQEALKFLCEKFEQLPGSRGATIDRIVIARQPENGAPFQVIRVALLRNSV
jgi:putative phosphonate metabolism protein